MPADPLAKEIIARTEQLVADRSTFESHFQEIRDYIRPQAAHFSRAGGTETKGGKDRARRPGGAGHLPATRRCR